MKQKGKRFLSLLLSVLMVMTVMSSMLAVIASATLTESDSTEYESFFYVPEVAYLRAVAGSFAGATSATFDIFIQDSISTSNLYNGSSAISSLSTSTTTTTGYVYFSYENLSGTPTISYRFVSSPSSTSTLSGGSMYIGGGTLAASTAKSMSSYSSSYKLYRSAITAASCTSPSLSTSTTGFYIEWTVSYVDATTGNTLQAIAYTYVYKPYTTPVVVALDTTNEANTNSELDTLSWLTGIHSISGTSSYYLIFSTSAYTTYAAAPFLSTRNYVAGGSGSIEPLSTSGILQTTSLLYQPNGTLMYAVFANQTSTYNYFNTRFIANKDVKNWITTTKNVSTTVSSSTTFDVASVTYKSVSTGSSTIDVNSYSVVSSAIADSTGVLYVDSSRYSNLNQIPNLGVGMMFTDLDDNTEQEVGLFYIADYTGLTTYYATGSYTTKSDYDVITNRWLDFNYIIAGGSSAGNASTAFTTSKWYNYWSGSIMDYSDNDGSDDLGVVLWAGSYGRSLTATSSGTTTTYRIKYSAIAVDGTTKESSWSNMSDPTNNIAYINLSVTTYDKSDLRSAVMTARNAFAQLGITGVSSSGVYTSLYYDTSSTYWTNFVNYYKLAEASLCCVDSAATVSYASSLTTYLNYLLAGYGLNSGTATEVDIALYPTSSGYAMALLGTNSLTYDYGNTVTFSSNSYTGYTYKTTTLSTTNYSSYFTTLDSTFSTNYLNSSTSSYYQIASVPTQLITSTSTVYNTTFNTSSSSAGKFITTSNGSSKTISSGVSSVSYTSGSGMTIVFVGACDSTLYLYNFYVATTYTVTYNPGSISSSSATSTPSGTSFSESYYYGLYYDFPDADDAGFTCTGYSFSGWSTTNGATTATYSPANDSVYNLGTCTLYAVWGANPYYLTYDANNGTGDTYSDGTTYWYDTAFTLLDIDDSELGWTYEHYTFTGWATTEDGSGSSLYEGGATGAWNIAQDYGENVTLYAQWIGNECTVVFIDYDGTVLGTYTVNYGNTVAAPTTYTTCYSIGDESYHNVFTGWAFEDGTTFTSNSTAITDDENVTYIYAQYTTESHSWNAGVITLETTCLYEGELTYTCTKCYDTKTEAIPCVDHVDSDRDGYCDNEFDRYTEDLGFTDNVCNYYIGLYVNTGGYDDEDAEPAGQRNITLTNSLGLTFSFRAYDDEDGEDIQDITGSAIIIYWLNKPLYFTISGYDDENWVPVIRINGAEVEADSDTGEYTIPAGLSLVTITVELGYYNSETGETSNFFDLLLEWLTKLIVSILKLFGLD